MQSTDEFTPSTTEPVFGTGLISQKTQSSTNNDISDNEKVVSSSEPMINGQNDTTNNKISLNENINNNTADTINTNTEAEDLSTTHLNGQNQKPTGELDNTIKSTEELTVNEKINEVESNVLSTEPKPVSSSPMDTTNEGTSSASTTVVDTAPPPAVDTAPTPVVETTTTSDDNVPQAPVAMESETPEPKSKSSRGKAKVPAATPAPTPTRQSARGRKAVPTSSTNAEENQTIDETNATPAPPPPTTTTTAANQPESSKRTKRQAATIQPNSTSDSNITDDINEGKTKNVSPSTRNKRGAAANTPKNAKGKNSNDDIDNDVSTIESETPTKKARTSANKKTPEPPLSEEYVRKLRPRK